MFIAEHLERPTRTAAWKHACTRQLLEEYVQSLFGLASSEVYRAVSVTKNAVGSYPTLSPLPVETGGLLSVALSVGLRRPGVTRHRISMKPGLSSPQGFNA